MATTNIANTAVKLTSNSGQYTRAMHRARRKTQQFHAAVKKAAIRVGLMGGVIALAGIKTMKLAAEQEKQERALAAALKLTGSSGRFAMEDMKGFASSLQDVTVYGDEALLKVMAMGAAMGKLAGSELKAATKAAIGLASAYGLDLTASMRLVARARVGDTSSLKRYGIVIDSTLSKLEQFNEVVKIGVQSFELAEEAAKTKAGQMTQMANLWGDLGEKWGNALWDGFTAVIGDTPSDVLKGLNKWFDRPSTDFMGVDDFVGTTEQKITQAEKLYDDWFKKWDRTEAQIEKVRADDVGLNPIKAIAKAAALSKLGDDAEVMRMQFEHLEKVLNVLNHTKGTRLETTEAGPLGFWGGLFDEETEAKVKGMVDNAKGWLGELPAAIGGKMEAVKKKVAGVVDDIKARLKKQREEEQKWKDRIGAVFGETRTPMERYKARLQDLRELVKKGLDVDTYTRAARQAMDVLKDASDLGFGFDRSVAAVQKGSAEAYRLEYESNRVPMQTLNSTMREAKRIAEEQKDLLADILRESEEANDHEHPVLEIV